MFEIIQQNGQSLRFDGQSLHFPDTYRWEYLAWPEGDSEGGRVIVEDRTIVRVFRTIEDGEEELITTVINPLRIDSVDMFTCLLPPMRLAVGYKCENCGHHGFKTNSINQKGV